MSAAEQLKALDETMLPGHWSAVTMDRGFNREIADLRNALPHIVAVVEAAERADALIQPERPDAKTLGRELGSLRVALAALKEALETK